MWQEARATVLLKCLADQEISTKPSKIGESSGIGRLCFCKKCRKPETLWQPLSLHHRHEPSPAQAFGVVPISQMLTGIHRWTGGSVGCATCCHQPKVCCRAQIILVSKGYHRGDHSASREQNAKVAFIELGGRNIFSSVAKARCGLSKNQQSSFSFVDELTR